MHRGLVLAGGDHRSDRDATAAGTGQAETEGQDLQLGRRVYLATSAPAITSAANGFREEWQAEARSEALFVELPSCPWSASPLTDTGLSSAAPIPSTYERQDDDDAYEEVTLDLTGAFSQKIPVRPGLVAV